MTNQEIKTVGQTIAAETQIGGNTAERVGGVIEGIGEALDNKDAAVGYYLATMSGSTIYINASSYRLGTGGNLRAKMPAAATTACTLTVGNANAVPLWYNGAAVSADNSWEAGEIVTIFYDGTRFMVSNSQGGGGQFGSGEKIKDILLSQALGDGTGTITSQKGVSDAIFNEIDISSIDSLKTLNDALAPSSSLKPTYYTVTATLSNVKLKVGSMAVISDNMRHVVTEIMATHYTLDDAGNLTNEHSDAEIFFIYRSVKLSGGTLPDAAGVWTKWRYVNASVWSTVAEKIKYNNSQSILSTENVQDTLDGITDELVFEDATGLSFGTTRNWTVNGSGNYAVATGYQCYMQRVYPGQKFRIKANSEHVAFYAFMASNPSRVTNGNPANFVTGYETRYTIPIGEAGSFTVPDVEGTIYLYIQKQTTSDFTPVYLHRLSTVKENIDNEIYSKDSLQLTTESNLVIEDATATEITASDNVNYTILYCAVNEGEILHITASNVSIKRFIISFSTEEPAADVAVTDVQDIRSTTIDELVKAPVTGYLVLSKYLTYYTDLNVIKIGGELAELSAENEIGLGNVDKKVNGYVPFMATASTNRQLLSNASLKWTREQTSSGSNKYTSRIEPISQYAGKVLVISLGAANSANAALLADNEHTPQEFAHFSRPWDRFIKLSTETPTVRVLLTENDKYLYYQVMNTAGNNDLSPSFRIEESDKETFDTIENYNLTLERTDYNLDEKDEETNPDGIEILPLGIVSSTQTWSLVTTNTLGFFLDVSNHKGGYLFVSNIKELGYLAFLKDNNNCDVQGAIPNYATGSGRTTIGTGMRIKFNIPTDANLVFFGYQNSSMDALYPAGVFAIGKDIGGGTEVGRTLDLGQINLQKKASQFLNIKWTAKSNIATWNGSRVYVEAGEQSGMLYSSVQEYDRCVGHDVSVKTFMTAVNNPYSLLYTEDCQDNTSDYGMVYYSAGGATTHAFFGTVCSRFACWASGMEEWDTGKFAWLCEQGYLTKIQDQSAQGVEIGDFVWIPGHVSIITNYVKSGGVVTSVTITEAVQPLVKLTTRTASGFDNYLAALPDSGNNSGPAIIYRNNEIYKNVMYEPSEFVAIEDEVPQEYQYNNDICTYAGDYAAFRLKGVNDTRNDYKVWLNYNLGDTPSRQWTGIKLYKETYSDRNVLSLVLKATYNDVDFTKHKYLIPSTDLTEVGKYRACLYAGNVESEPTYFEIIDTNVSYTKNGDVITVNFSSSNGTPTKIAVGTLGGSRRAVRTLTESERMDGVVSFNPKAWSAEQTSVAYDEDDAYIKVFFKGEYGRVTNEPLKINYNS